MKDYTATLTVNVAIQAPNDEVAQQRAEVLADALVIGQPFPRWRGDQEPITVEVEEA